MWLAGLIALLRGGALATPLNKPEEAARPRATKSLRLISMTEPP
jgi:hypothetical protein